MRASSRALASWGIMLAVCLFGGLAVQARTATTFTIDDVAAKAEVLAAGEVVAVTAVSTLAPAATAWKLPLQQMQAKVRVLRTFPQGETAPLQPGQEITVPYLAVDWAKAGAASEAPYFPALAVGDTNVFPLRKAADGNWALIGDENYGMLVPCARETFKDATSDTAAAFLLTELVGAFALGDYPTLHRGGQYFLSSTWRSLAAFDAVVGAIEKSVTDEPRWLDIAVAGYAALPAPRATIAALKGAPKQQPLELFVAKALGHCTPDGLDDRIITTTIKQARVHLWGSATTIATNYAANDTAIRQLRQGLLTDSTEAFILAGQVIKDKTSTLVRPALMKATRVLATGKEDQYGSLQLACTLIRDYGTKPEFDALLKQILDAKDKDQAQFTLLWNYSAYGKGARAIEICRALLPSQAPYSGDLRYCDLATLALQWVTGENFGAKPGQSLADRNTALNAARAWITKYRFSTLNK